MFKELKLIKLRIYTCVKCSFPLIRYIVYCRITHRPGSFIINLVSYVSGRYHVHHRSLTFLAFRKRCNHNAQIVENVHVTGTKNAVILPVFALNRIWPFLRNFKDY